MDNKNNIFYLIKDNKFTLGKYKINLLYHDRITKWHKKLKRVRFAIFNEVYIIRNINHIKIHRPLISRHI